MENKIKNRRKISSGKIFDAYFESENFPVLIETRINFGKDSIEKEYMGFEFNNKIYVIIEVDHMNGHFSGNKDKSAVYSISIGELY